MNTTRKRKIINLAGAETVMKTAEAFARDRGYRVVIAIVDPWGNPVLLKRLEGTQMVSSQVALDKARTAAIFVRPSRVLEEQVSAGRVGALTLHGAAPLTGGVPLVVDGEVVGAIGASGETPDQDEAVSIAGAGVPFSVDTVYDLRFEDARTVASAAAAVAASRNVAPVITVVDAGGEVVYTWRPDAAQVASVGVATDKARTAALYRRPSKDFEDQVARGRASALALARAVPLQGGLPLMVDGQVVGAIGVSGASSADEDNELAGVGVRAFMESNPMSAFFLEGKSVAAKFRMGGLLLDTPGYKVDAGRRDGPGEVEWHASVTDIMHVQSGTATVVLGGEMVNAREVKPGEVRADSINGGQTFKLAPGDVLVIPNGQPHWFRDVPGPFEYYVVKVVSSHGV
jgi:glc operon protein GlcG